MPTTHAWKGASGTYILDPAQYADGTAFAPGDTLAVGSGNPTIGSLGGSLGAGLAPLTTGTYQFAIAGTSAGLATDNIALDRGSAIAVTGAGSLEWVVQDQFVNNGAIQAGSAAAPGAVDIVMSATKPATLVNQGSITVQNGSLLRLQPITANGGFMNAAGGDGERRQRQPTRHGQHTTATAAPASAT